MSANIPETTSLDYTDSCTGYSSESISEAVHDALAKLSNLLKTRQAQGEPSKVISISHSTGANPGFNSGYYASVVVALSD